MVPDESDSDSFGNERRVLVNVNRNGKYTFAGLPAGNYQLTAEATGFKRTVFPSVTVTAGSTINVDLKLEMGGVAESVEVVERVATIDVSTARVATNVTSKLVENLPLVVGERSAACSIWQCSHRRQKPGAASGSAGDRAQATTC